MIKNLRRDFEVNSGNTRGLIIVLSYRLSNAIYGNNILKVIFFPFLLYYTIFIRYILSFDVPHQTNIGPGLRVFHGFGVAINSGSVIGANVTIRQNATIGNKANGGGCPTIGDNCEIGAGAIIVGKISIGSNSIIGAGAVVTKDVPDNHVMVGNPARRINYAKPQNDDR